MKLYLLVFSMLIGCTDVFAQPKVITQAIISTTTNVIAPEEEEQNNPGGGGMNFRNFMDGETKSTTYLKNDMVKTVLKSDVARSTIFRNNSTKITTTYIEAMGNKFGFYASDSDQVEMKRKYDSTRLSRRKNDSTGVARPPQSEQPVEISYGTGSKKIAGYACKNAYIITTHFLGLKDTVEVWYTPEIKLQHIASTGGLSGIGNMGTINGLDKIDGFVMRYEMNLPRKRRMEVEVTKIDTSKDIADKEFDLPKDIEVKPIKEMQNMFGGRGFQRQN